MYPRMKTPLQIVVELPYSHGPLGNYNGKCIHIKHVNSFRGSNAIFHRQIALLLRKVLKTSPTHRHRFLRECILLRS